MELSVIQSFANVAAPAGLAIGAFLYISRDLIAKNIFPTLTKERAYHVVLALAFMAWTVALTGIGAWIYVTTRPTAAVERPKPLSDVERAKLVSALQDLTYLEAGQSPVHFLLRISCESQDAKPNRQLKLVADQNLREVNELLTHLRAGLPSDFIVGEHQAFRQVVLDLQARATILPALANGDSFILNGRNRSCELSSTYQSLHERLRPLEDRIRSYIEKR